jgi:hypothetical protein
MTVKCAYLNEGILCGDVSESLSDETKSYIFDKPVILQLTEKGIVISNLLGMFIENQITVRESDIKFGQLFTPVEEIVKYYESQVNPSQILTPPDKKLIV